MIIAEVFSSMKRFTVLVTICIACMAAKSVCADVSAPALVAEEALFWLDASTLSQSPGEDVTEWIDVRGEGHPVARTPPDRKSPKMVSVQNGYVSIKAVDFGAIGSNSDMAFIDVQESVVTAFFVMEIDKAKYACMLGGADNRNSRFCRENENSYASNKGQTGDYSIWTNGEKIADPLNTATPSGYNLITYRFDDSGPSDVGYLASDRNESGRQGGKRLSEVIAFNRILSDEERTSVEAYLRAKWFGDVLGDKIVGAGETLTLVRPFSDSLVVKKDGKVVVHSVAYTSYRFKLEGIKGENPIAVQLSELKLLDGDDDVTRPYVRLDYDKTGEVAGKIYPDNENPEMLVDGDLGTKWLDWRLLPSHSESDRERVWLRIDYPAPKRITGYAWYTANDDDKRDPSAWRLQGSNDDGATWTDIDVRTSYSATERRKSLAGRFGVPSGAFMPGSHVFVESGATLNVIGGVVPVSSIVNFGGTVELSDGAVLLSEGGEISGSVSGSGKIKVSRGRTTLLGAQKYTGETHVSGGALEVGNPLPGAFDGKYFRLTFKRSNGGTSRPPDELVGDNKLQVSEFHLYTADGVNLCTSLGRAADGTSADSLEAGTYSCARNYGGSASYRETIESLFDGEISTKYLPSEKVDGNPDNWQVIVMRLADDAAPVAGYNFFTANDQLRRSPTCWSIEGSRDGITWELLDERWWAPHTQFSDKKKYGQSSGDIVPGQPFNGGVNYQFETAIPPKFNGRFLRFTFQKTAGDTILQLSELQILDAVGQNVAIGLVKGSDGASAKDLEPGSFCKGGNYASGSNEDMDKLFDDSTETKLCAINNNLKGDEANYRVLTIRLANDTLPLCGYLFVTANDLLSRSPSRWKVEGSFDGETWTVLDERKDVETPYCLYTAMNAGRPFAFSSLSMDNTTLPEGSVVTVNAGAKLNLNATDARIGALRVDCSAGGGTINAFRPAAGGTLELVNVPEDMMLGNCVVPITVTDVQDEDNLCDWSVTVNGVRRMANVKYRDGKIELMVGGFFIIVR